MALFHSGKEEKNVAFEDATKSVANREYFLEFAHIPTGKTVQFKAMLTSLQDKFSSNWKDDSNVFGRMDPMSIFQNTRREISLAWDVVASSEEEAKGNLGRISLLICMLYPVYDADTTSNASSMAAAPLMKMTFTNLIMNNSSARSSNAMTSGLVGKISGLVVSPEMEEGFFDKGSGVLYPKSHKISFTYTVYHTHRVGWVKGSGFSVKNYPYGVSHTEARSSSTSAGVDSKTTPQKQAAVDRMTKRNKR